MGEYGTVSDTSEVTLRNKLLQMMLQFYNDVVRLTSLIECYSV
jgi:hypothetical protein